MFVDAKLLTVKIHWNFSNSVEPGGWESEDRKEVPEEAGVKF